MSTTASRLLLLLSVLQVRREWPGPILAERLGVSGRTVRRDISRLRELGYRIDAATGVDGGYRLGSGEQMPPLLFDEDQTVAVAVALRIAPATGAGIAEPAARALATIRQVMPPRLRHRLDTLDFAIVAGRLEEGTAATVPAELLVQLATCIRTREVLRFDYLDLTTAAAGRPSSSLRRVEPHHLATSHGRWYLLGWDLDREDWRLFRVDRMRPRVPTGPRFPPREVPGGDAADFVTARFRGGEVDEWPCRGTVILEMPAAEVLPFAGEATVHVVDDSRCSVEAGAWSWGALATWFGRFDTPMEVVGPLPLAEAFALLAERCGHAAAAFPSARP